MSAAENSSRGVWSITDYGRTLQLLDMSKIPVQVRAMWRKGGVRTKLTAEDEEAPEVAEPESESLGSTLLEDWHDRLLSVLQSIPPTSFERLCQRLLRESDFTQVEVTGRSGDGGIEWNRGPTNRPAELPSLLPVQAIQGQRGCFGD